MHKEINGLVDNSPLGLKDSLVSKTLGKVNSLDVDNKNVKIIVSCNKSKHIPKLFFSNKLKYNTGTNTITSNIIELIKLNGIEIAHKDVPFIFDDSDNDCFLSTTRINDFRRINGILNLYGFNFAKNTYAKCSFKSKIGNFDYGLPKDTLRIFVSVNPTKIPEWNIVLIDPWHLVATDRFVQNFNKNKDKQNYIYNLENLKFD